MNEYQKYIDKVLCYCSMEYGIQQISVKEFVTIPGANVFMDIIFNCFSANRSFQHCAGKLMSFYKEQAGISPDAFYDQELNEETEETNDAESN